MTGSSHQSFGLIGRRELLCGGAALLAGCGGETSRPLLSADTHPNGYPTVEAVRFMGEELRRRTNGRLGVKIFAGAQLGVERDTLEITSFGGLDLNRVNLAPLNSIEPLTEVLGLPFLFRDAAHLHRVLDGEPGRIILDSLAKHELIGLCYYDSGERSFYNTRGPINEPTDMAGMKIRVPNSDLYLAMVRGLGANPTPIAFAEVYQSLVQGVIDGAENNWPSYENARHFEAAGYYSLTRHLLAPEVLVMSKKSWDRLSADDQTSVRESALLSVGVMRELWAARVEEARATILASGVQVNQVANRDAFADAMRPVWNDFMRSPEQKRVLAMIEALADA